MEGDRLREVREEGVRRENGKENGRRRAEKRKRVKENLREEQGNNYGE